MKKIVSIILLLAAAHLLLCDELAVFKRLNNDFNNIRDLKSVLWFDNEDVIASISNNEKVTLIQNGYQIRILDIDSLNKRYSIVTNTVSDNKLSLPALYSKTGLSIYRNEDISSLRDRYMYRIIELKPLVLPKETKHFQASMTPSARTEITDVLAYVNQDTITVNLQHLEDFGTRFCVSPEITEAENWLHQKFGQYGITEFRASSFEVYNYPCENVIAIVPGTEFPDDIIVIGGHHDSIVNSGDPFVSAPGADDNGTGTITALEVARVLLAAGYQPKHTLMFMTYSAEELGLYGSHAIADEMALQEENVVLMLNNDMIGTQDEMSDWYANLIAYEGYEYVKQAEEMLMDEFTVLQSTPWNQTNSHSSDSWSFYQAGYPTIFNQEYTFSPFYHSIDDLLVNCNLPYFTEMIKLNVASLIFADKYYNTVQDFDYANVGNGTDINLFWNDDAPENGTYRVGIGSESGEYTNFYDTADTLYTLTGLTEGQDYYIGVAIVFADGQEGIFTEISVTPTAVPVAPRDFAVDLRSDGIYLNWNPNTELDLQGYMLYRKAEFEDTFTGTLINEAFFADHTASPEYLYDYYLTALDQDLNESSPTETLRGAILSFSNGILIVDDTAAGNGSFMRPTRAECEAFYTQTLSDFEPTMIDTEDFENITLADLCRYSTVLWFCNSITSGNMLAFSASVISEYCEAGGKILVAGYKTMSQLAAIPGYPYESEEGDILDLFGVSEVNYATNAAFNYAESQFTSEGPAGIGLNYDLVWDSYDSHLLMIEAISPDVAEPIYLWGTDFTPDTIQGQFEGSVVGSINSTQSTCGVLTFPPYYMDPVAFESNIGYILTTYYAESVGNSEDTNPGIRDLVTLSNYPNPFNPVTNIKFSISSGGDVQLDIYNAKGQKVRKLISDKLARGQHTVVWNGKDKSGKECSSGIYFVKLQSNSGNKTIKTILMK